MTFRWGKIPYVKLAKTDSNFGTKKDNCRGELYVSTDRLVMELNARNIMFNQPSE